MKLLSNSKILTLYKLNFVTFFFCFGRKIKETYEKTI